MGMPDATLGIAGDLFFAQDTNRLYQKTSSGWPSMGNLLQGAMGLTGVDGTTFYSGPGAPTFGAREDDLYLNLTGGEIFKYVSGSWTDQGYSIKGDPGEIGATGPAGAALQTGNGSPTSDIGNVNDMYLDLVASVLFGPKTSSGWSSSGKSIVGATGAQGTPGVRGSITFTGHGPPTDGQFDDALGQDFYLDLDSGLLYANTTSGVQAGTAAFPPAVLLSDVGILTLKQDVQPGLITDFQAAGDTQTFRFVMPYAGWVLGYSFFGQCSPAIQIGSYITKKDLSGNYTDEVHVAGSDQTATDLTNGYSNFVDAPPRYEPGEMVAMKIEVGTGSPSSTVDITGFLHLQYDPSSATKVANLQAPGANAASSTTSSTSFTNQ
jgi:hypothetical protein